MMAACLVGCGNPESAGPASGSAGSPPPEGANAPDAPNAPGQAAGGEVKPVPVVIETSMGTIELELYPDKAPVTVENFVKYAKKGHYDGTVFHRVIPGFMIQGGGFTPDLTEKPTDPPIKNEAGNGLKNDRGTIAMARTGDPNSATAQFYINVADNGPLNKDQDPNGFGYAVFGKVTSGMDVVDKIVMVKTAARNGMEDVPVEPVTVKSVKAG